MQANRKSLLSATIYIAVFLTMALLYGVFERMNLGPYSNHQWRQSDCLSITQHYADGAPFLQPEIYWLGEKGEGKTISEFPIVYYSVGKLWSFFGRQYWMYRIICFLIFALGLYYLRKLAVEALKNDFWGSFIALFVFTSPVLIFYSNNFLMNVNALSFAMIGGYHFYKYRTSDRFRSLMLACLFFLLAGLFKLTALLLFFCLGAIFLYERITKRDLKKRWKEFLPFAGVLLIIFIWYSYVNNYNSKHLSQIFLQGTLPIWELSSADIWSNFKLLTKELFPEVFPLPVLGAILLIGLIVLIRLKVVNRFWLALTILATLSALLYLLLFYQALNQHEYYLINISIVVPIVLLTFFGYLNSRFPSLLKVNWLKGTAVVVLVLMAYNGGVQTRVKFSTQESWVTNSPFMSEEKAGFWNWFHWNYDVHFRELETIELYLEELGIQRTDKVLSIPDISINVSLFLMNRPGYTSFWVMADPQNQQLMGPERYLKTIDWGVEYVVVNDTSILSQPGMHEIIGEELGHRNNVYIYSSRKR